VTQIVESLKQALDQMEEVLELVEVAERQKLADEREIESLRQTLRKIHQPRAKGASRHNKLTKLVRRLLQTIPALSRLHLPGLTCLAGAKINDRAVFAGRTARKFPNRTGIPKTILFG